MKHHPPAGAFTRARRLRGDMTVGERKLWRLLREHFAEWHFRREVPIRHFIADFASHRAKLSSKSMVANMKPKWMPLVRRPLKAKDTR